VQLAQTVYGLQEVPELREVHGHDPVNVLVIGCGPAGLAAAHAAHTLGANVEIRAPKQKTPQRGPILIQRAIPEITTTAPQGYVRQMVIGGSVLDYRLRLYGDINININGDILEHGYATWRVQEAYDKLWKLYSDLILDTVVTPEELVTLPDKYGLVVNTAPRNRFCMWPKKHEFLSKPIALTPATSYPGQPPDTIIFNAYKHVKWVRSSWVFEAQVTEWDPSEYAPDEAHVIHKPISTTCDCHPMVFRAGRFGTWHNENWIDGAYFDTYRMIISMIRKREWEDIR